MIKLIVFDVDGTLIDTDDIILATWKEVFSKFKDESFKYDDNLILTFSGPTIKDTMSKYLPEYDFEYMRDQYNEITRKYYESLARLFDGEKEVLEQLHKDGYKLAVLTNKNRERTEYCLNKFNIFGLFDYVVSSDDVKETKPNPEGLLKILSNYKDIKKDEVIVIGDTDYDYLTAKNDSINAILMTLCPRHYNIDTKPLCFCKSYKELYKAIKSYD